MDDSDFMAVSNSIDQDPDMPANLTLGESLLLADLLVELAAGHVVEDEDDAVLLLVDLVDVHYARVVESYQHVDLVAGFDEEGLVDLGCEGLAGVAAGDLAHG